MGRRSRKAGRVAGATADAPAPRATRTERNRARDEETRAKLRPLAPGERPRALVVAAAVAALIGLGNLALYLAGVEVRGQEPALANILVLTVLMVACAYGLWRARYWAVLGFEALLALTAVYAAISLAVASNLSAVALCLVIIGLSGWLFWKLVRIMARIQLPRRVPPPA